MISDKGIVSGLVFLLLLLSGIEVYGQEMFDDFSYLSSEDPEISEFSWTIRSGAGGPGPAGCTWSKKNLSFLTEPDGNTVMRMQAGTSGSGNNTSQCEIYTSRDYLAGTYAARIRFSDSPFSGTTPGDKINETFFAISPLSFALDPDYSETDFVEYLPNGGWGVAGSTYWMTSWETYQETPWIQQSKSDKISKSFEGWHEIACIINDGEIRYYLDGKIAATHGGIYYPESLMSINFNLWFLSDGIVSSSTGLRTYVEDIDWVYHAKDSVVDPQILSGIIENFRNQGIVSRQISGKIRYAKDLNSIESETPKKNEFSIFQDLVSENLTIYNRGSENVQIGIYNMDGRLLYKGTASQENNSFNCRKLNLKGLIVVVLSKGTMTYSSKLLIK